jgi:prophage antirepressor-like protein
MKRRFKIMRNNLKLITTETFGDLSCNFYCNMNDDILLTREQIGSALEYSNPDIALSKIHKKHSDRLDNLSVVTKLVSTDGKSYETILYTQRGIMEICRWSRQPKADIFMDWVWDIIEKYRANELVPVQQQIDMAQISNTISNAIILALQPVYEKLSNIEEQSNKKKLPEKKYSRWKTNTFNKLNTLHSYVNEHSDENLKLSETIHLVIEETEDTYAIEINDYVDAYKSEFDLDTNPYVLDVINRYKDVRDMFSLTLDSVMEKLHLIDKSDKSKPRNIFDELASKLEK